MAKGYTKSQAKRAYESIRSKANKLSFGSHAPSVPMMSLKDLLAIDAIVQKYMKKF
jgi:hypothetical protein